MRTPKSRSTCLWTATTRVHRPSARWASIGSLTAGLLATAFSLFAVGGSAAVSAAPALTNDPRVPLPHHGVANTWAATNWSGYAETAQTVPFTGVSGTWTVPAVSFSRQATYSSAWIGVDGFNNSKLIQTGTEEDWYGGAPHYNAWWEILPAAETAIPTTTYPVAPGDRMSASIWETSASTHSWNIVISDSGQTHNWKFSTTQTYGGPGTSAEWIVEAPQVGGRIATLAHYTITPPPGYGDFDGAGTLSSIVSIGTPTYTSAGLNYGNDSGVMIQKGGQVSTPGNPDSAKTAFNAQYGAAVPSTPTG